MQLFSGHFCIRFVCRDFGCEQGDNESFFHDGSCDEMNADCVSHDTDETVCSE